MAERNWGLIVAALFGLICFAFVGGYMAGALNYPHQERYQRYERPSDEPPEITWTAPFAERAKYREPCKRPQGRNDSDLCAQWKAARAAESSALWAKWSFFLGIAGTVGLFWTLFYTRKAVRVAQDATKDADAALEIARDNADATAAHVKVAQDAAKHQLRPYIAVRAVVFRVSDDFDIPENEIRIEWINNGQTPGKIKKLHIQCFWLTKKSVLLLDIDQLVGHELHTDTPTRMSFAIKSIDDESVGRLAVTGTFEYTDVFNGAHRGTFDFSSKGGLTYGELADPTNLSAAIVPAKTEKQGSKGRKN